MNIENQLQAAYANMASMQNAYDSLQKSLWALQEQRRTEREAWEKERETERAFHQKQMADLMEDSRKQREQDRAFYEGLIAELKEENRNLQQEQQRHIDAAVEKLTKQLVEVIAERDAARLEAKMNRGKRFASKSERNPGKNNRHDNDGENREAEKQDFVNAEEQRKKDAEKAAAESAPDKGGDTLDAEKLIKKLKRQHPGAEIVVERIDYSKAKFYTDNAIVHKLEDYFTLSDGESFRTGANGEIEKSYLRVLIRIPERIEEHIYEAAHVRSKTEDEYKTTDRLDVRPVPGCMFSNQMLVYILCEKFQYHTPFRQIVKKLQNRGLDISRSVLGEHVHRALEWLAEKMTPVWQAIVRKSWILMLDETRTKVGCKDEESGERKYKNKYMWGLRAVSMKLAWFIYENGSRGAAAIRPFLEGFLGFYTTDGYVVYKIFDSSLDADEDKKKSSKGKGRRSACLVHIRRLFVDALIEDKRAMWFIDNFGNIFSIDHRCMRLGLKGHDRLIERLKPGSTADIMKMIEVRLLQARETNYEGYGELMKKALKYALGEWPAMKRVLECGDVELSNNLTEQMMRSIKTNLKNGLNIGSEESAKHNAFMYSIIESCKMNKLTIESYLSKLLEKLQHAREGDDLTGCLPCYLTV